MPREFKFIPLTEFEWVREYDDGETLHVATYYPGNSYNCTREPRHDALREMCKHWEADGKIMVIPLLNGQQFKTIPVGGNS